MFWRPGAAASFEGMESASQDDFNQSAGRTGIAPLQFVWAIPVVVDVFPAIRRHGKKIEAGSGGSGGFFSDGLLVRRFAGRFLKGKTQGRRPANAGTHLDRKSTRL